MRRPRLVLAVICCAALTHACTQPDAVARGEGSGPLLPPPTPLPSNETLVARAKPLELGTPYVPPLGDPLEIGRAHV